jgi:cell division protease FtsH
MRQHRSEKLEELIDAEMQEIIAAGYQHAKNILQQKLGKLHQMAQTLLEKEKIDESDIRSILGTSERPPASRA